VTAPAVLLLGPCPLSEVPAAPVPVLVSMTADQADRILNKRMVSFLTTPGQAAQVMAANFAGAAVFFLELSDEAVAALEKGPPDTGPLMALLAAGPGTWFYQQPTGELYKFTPPGWVRGVPAPEPAA
jgi:hypothetical protein